MASLCNFNGSNTAIFSAEEEADKQYTDKVEGKAKSDAAYQDIKYKRVPKQNLDKTFAFDGVTFGMINRKIQKVMAAGSKIVAEKKKDQPLWDEFFNRIGEIGQPLDLEEIHEKVFYDKLKYGVSYIEYVFDKDFTKVTDIKSLDTRAMDYARDGNNNIYFNNETQRPLGYVIQVDTERVSQVSSDPLPKGVQVKLEPNQIFVYQFRIAALPLTQFGNGWEYMGLIEPAFSSKVRKDKLMEAAVNEAYITGSNPVYAILGDNNRRPSKQQKKKTLEALQHIRHSSASVFEYPTDIKTLDVQHSDIYEKFIALLNNDQANAASYPLGLLNSPDDTPRSALKQMKEELDISEQSVVDKYVKQFNKQVLDYIAKVNRWDTAKLVWGDVSYEDKEAVVGMVLSCVEKRIFTPEQVFEKLNALLNLKADIKDMPEEIDMNEMMSSGDEEKKPEQEKEKEKPKEEKKVETTTKKE